MASAWDPSGPTRGGSTPPSVEIRLAFQPVVELDSGDVVGHEVLVRGPEGPLAMPVALLDDARRSGSLLDLDVAIVDRTVEHLRLLERDGPHLWVNLAPETIGHLPVAALSRWTAALRGRSDVVLEVNERLALADPPGLLAEIDGARRRGWTIALDDVGSTHESLSMLPLVRPDVVKLDASVVQGTSPDADRIAERVSREVRRSGAVLLAEGVETPEHLDRARSFGATLAQGWLFGPPADQRVEARRTTLPRLGAPVVAGSSAMRSLVGRHDIRTVDGEHLAAQIRELVRLAEAQRDETLFVVSRPTVVEVDTTADSWPDDPGLALGGIATVGAGADRRILYGIGDRPDHHVANGEWCAAFLGPDRARAVLATPAARPDGQPGWTMVEATDLAEVRAVADLIVRGLPT